MVIFVVCAVWATVIRCLSGAEWPWRRLRAEWVFGYTLDNVPDGVTIAVARGRSRHRMLKIPRISRKAEKPMAAAL